jgi:hypothetical protein
MKIKLCNYLTTLHPDTTSGQLQELLETPPESTMGDFALPCFAFAKSMRKNPKLIAEELAAGLLANRDYGVWDYRRLPFNYHGQICLVYSLLWIPVSFGAMLLYALISKRMKELRTAG